MGLSRTDIKKGDKVKVISIQDGYKTPFPKDLKLGKTYRVLDVCDDYFNGHLLIIKVGTKRVAVFPQGFTHTGYVDRFEIVGKVGKNSCVI